MPRITAFLLLGTIIAVLAVLLWHPAHSAPVLNAVPIEATSVDALPIDPPAKASPNAHIFDTTLYSNKPAANGMSQQMQMIYPNYMARDLEGAVRGLRAGFSDADLKLLLDQAAAHGATYIAFDVEGAYAPDKTVEASMQRLVKTARAYKPALKYGCCYLPATYPAGSAHQGTLQQVQAANNALATTMALMDFALPEAYLHDDPGKGIPVRAAWLAYMKMGVAESHRMMPGKPVFPVLELCIADYGWAGPMTAKGPIATPLLLAQIHAAQEASGGSVVLWGATEAGTGGALAPWDAKASWLKAMRDGNYLSPTPTTQTPATQ